MNLKRWSLEDMARKNNVSRVAIMKYCKTLGLKRRTNGNSVNNLYLNRKYEKFAAGINNAKSARKI